MYIGKNYKGKKLIILLVLLPLISFCGFKISLLFGSSSAEDAKSLNKTLEEEATDNLEEELAVEKKVGVSTKEADANKHLKKEELPVTVPAQVQKKLDELKHVDASKILKSVLNGDHGATHEDHEIPFSKEAEDNNPFNKSGEELENSLNENISLEEFLETHIAKDMLHIVESIEKEAAELYTYIATNLKHANIKDASPAHKKNFLEAEIKKVIDKNIQYVFATKKQWHAKVRKANVVNVVVEQHLDQSKDSNELVVAYFMLHAFYKNLVENFFKETKKFNKISISKALKEKLVKTFSDEYDKYFNINKNLPFFDSQNIKKIILKDLKEDLETKKEGSVLIFDYLKGIVQSGKVKAMIEFSFYFTIEEATQE